MMDKLYSLSRIIERVRTEQIDQTNFMGHVKQIWEENKTHYKNFARKFEHNYKFSL